MLAMMGPISAHQHHHHHGHNHASSNHSEVSPADLALLAMLAAEPPRRLPAKAQRRPQMDPLILQTAAVSGPG